MIRRDFLRMTGAGLAGAALLGVTGCSEDESQKASLTIAGPAGQVEYLEKWTKKWEKETGGKVSINAIPFTEIDDKLLTATGTGTFVADIYYIGTGTAGQLMAGGDVLEVPSDLRNRLGLDEVAPIFRDYQLSWAGKMYGLPWDGDILNLYYRRDLFEDQRYVQGFRAEYGPDLGVPDTWEEYGNIAEFFDEKDWDGDGQPNYGLVELPMRNNHAWDGFFSRAAAYAKHPDDPGFFFDTDAMEPRIDNPGFVEALEDWMKAMQWGPPDMLNYGWSENAQTFIGGRAALDIQWGDIGPMSLDEEQSVVKGKVGYAVNPGTTEVWNPKSRQWDTFDEPNRAPFAGFGGWIFVVPELTKDPDAAWDLATYLGRPEVRRDAVITPGSGINPNSFDQLNDIDLWTKAGFSEEDAKAYTGAIIDSLKHPNAVLDLRIPGFSEYKKTLELAISKALSGQAPPDEALEQAAEDWKSITQRLNRDRQLQYYRDSLGL
jgi:multiple sugar transport system substrate-binding protein